MKILLALTLTTFCTACVIQPPPRANDPYYSPVLASSQRVAASQQGSTYQDGYGLSLYGDRKARRIGDVITIDLSERTVSSKSAGTTITKDAKVAFNEDSDGNTVLGTNPSFKNLSFATNLDQSREFEGDAAADQSNSLQGSISVTVVDVFPNGNLVVRGEKWITLNQGDEFIRVSGILRPEDITPLNTVASSKLADARISYGGTGALASSQEQGWLSKVFNSIFWPF